MNRPDQTVFVIDDDVEVRNSLVALLEGKGFPVRTFDSAIAFLEVVETLGDGCVVTDLMLPGMSGLDLHRSLSKRGSTLPIIVVTGYGDTGERARAEKTVAGYLEKPYRAADLVAAIQAALQRDG